MAKGSNKKGKAKRQKKKSALQIEKEKIAVLNSTISKLNSTDVCTTFDELPLSKHIAAQIPFEKTTMIQGLSLTASLMGRDVVGHACTGSGKTLAFMIPTLELLYRTRSYGGLGAVIVLPTRELAMQVFDVATQLNKRRHSIALVIGGVTEMDISASDVIVATPGRLLEMLDKAKIDPTNLKMVVLDEFDRLLDMGFRPTLETIVQHLPSQRQTLLFTATLPKDQDRKSAFLNLRSPLVFSTEEKSPSQLKHYLMKIPLHEKINTLFGFLRSHQHKKILVFCSSCKQTRFLGEILRLLRPGMLVTALHGKLNQKKRLKLFYQFADTASVCMLATDVASRGLDFPKVDWVVQMDCPEDAETYIHRAGRTARKGTAGNALLFLSPSEMKFLDRLSADGILPQVVEPNAQRIQSQNAKIASLLSKDANLKQLGQTAFISYMRSVFLQKDKEVFDVRALPYREYASSIGLPGAPRIKFAKKRKVNKNKPYALQQNQEAGEEDTYHITQGDGKKTRMQRLMGKVQGIVPTVIDPDEQKAPADDSMFTLKREDHALDDAAVKDEDHALLKSGAVVPLEALDPDRIKKREREYAAELKDEVAKADPYDRNHRKRIRKRARMLERQRLREESIPQQGAPVLLSSASIMDPDELEQQALALLDDDDDSF